MAPGLPTPTNGGRTLHHDGSPIAAWASDHWWLEVTPEAVPRLPFPVFLRIEETPEGERRCAGMVIGPGADRDITIRALRHIPVPELISQLALYEADSDPISQFLMEDVVVPEATTSRPTRGPGRRRRLTDDDYLELAEQYRAVVKAGLVGSNGRPNPIQRLAAQHHVSEPTIKQRLAAARARGFLGRGVKGRAGEQTDPEEGTR